MRASEDNENLQRPHGLQGDRQLFQNVPRGCSEGTRDKKAACPSWHCAAGPDLPRAAECLHQPPVFLDRLFPPAVAWASGCASRAQPSENTGFIKRRPGSIGRRAVPLRKSSGRIRMISWSPLSSRRRSNGKGAGGAGRTGI